jgi:hypothetical protein
MMERINIAAFVAPELVHALTEYRPYTAKSLRRDDGSGQAAMRDVASSICVVDATGNIVREDKIASEPEVLIAWFGSLGYALTRIGLEAGVTLRSACLRAA